jgi:hypothetical protein
MKHRRPSGGWDPVQPFDRNYDRLDSSLRWNAVLRVPVIRETRYANHSAAIAETLLPSLSSAPPHDEPCPAVQP